jgi:DNA helicase TIP49 (TBP-interacting protein)
MGLLAIAQRLALAENHVQHGDAQVRRQRSLVENLELHGLGVQNARQRLMELEAIQTFFVEERDRLASALAASAAAPGEANGAASSPSGPR